MLNKLNIQAYVIKIRNVSFIVYLRHYFIGYNETFFFFWNISDVENFRVLIWGNKVKLKVKEPIEFRIQCLLARFRRPRRQEEARYVQTKSDGLS